MSVLELKTPVHISLEQENIIPPVFYEEKLYFINEAKLQSILSCVGLLREFILISREQGYNYLTIWLNKKGLLNEGFLENVSAYVTKNAGVKKNLNYIRTTKNFAYEPVIPQNYIKDYFKYSLIFSYIQDHKIEFNIFAETHINKLEKKLAKIKDPQDFNKKIFRCRSNIFAYLIGLFLIDVDYRLKSDFNYIDGLDVNISTFLNKNKYTAGNTGNLKYYKNNKFILYNKEQREYIDENSAFEVVFLKNGSRLSCFMPEFLLEKAGMLAKQKIMLETGYIDDILCQISGYQHKIAILGNVQYDSEIELHSENNQTSAVKVLQSINRFVNNIQQTDQNIEDVLIRQKQYINESLFSIQQNYIADIYLKAKDSNIIVDSKSNLVKLTAYSNLDSSNQDYLNSFLFNGNEDIKSSIVEFLTLKEGFLLTPSGYAKLSQ